MPFSKYIAQLQWPNGQFKLWMAMRLMNQEGITDIPNKRLAEVTAMDLSSISVLIRKLQDRGALKVTREGRGNTYTCEMTALEAQNGNRNISSARSG